MLTGIAALSRYWPWALGAVAALALAYFAWTVKGWADKAARVDAAEIAAKASQTALEAEKADRVATDAARLTAGLELERQLEAARANVRVVIRDRVKLIPVDRPCLTVEAGKALNELRR